MSGTTRCGSEAPPPAASADQGPAVARPGPNIASQPTVTASRGTPIQAGVAGTKWKAASAAADVVERTAAQAAAAQAAAASAKGAAAAAHAALAAGMVDEQEICSAAAVGKVPGAAESAVYSRCETVGEEAAAAAAKAAAAAISAAAEAASAAAAVAEAATGNDECQMSSHVEDFLVSQGLRVAVALEAAATAAATAADAATQVAVATTSQAAEKSSNAIAAAAQRCHEAAASAAASAVAAFSAAASSTVDSIASTAAAARAAIGEVTGAATQKLIEATKAFEDAIAAKTVALESALLWRESVKSNSEASGSRSSSSFLGHRLRSSSQFSSSSNRSRTRGRSSLLHYFSSDYEREGSQGGAPDVPFNGAGTPELTATAEGKLIGGAAVAAFLSDGKEPLLPHEYGLEVSGLFKGEEGTSQPEQPSNAAPVPTTDTLPRKDSVDAIVAAAAAEAAAYEALAAQQLHEQHEFSGSFSRFGSLCESPPVAAPAAEAGAPASTRLRAAANATESNSPVASLTRTYLPEHEAETPARRAALAQTSRCEDTEVRQPQQRILQMQVRHTSALPNNLDELQEHEQLQVRHEPTLYSLGGKDCGKEWHRGNACEGESNSRVRSGCRNSSRDADLDRTTNTCFSPAASRRVSARCCLGSSLQLKVTCSAESGTGSGDSRKCRSLLECRLEDFLEQCTADQSEVSACSCGNCSSRWGVPGQPPFNLQFTQPLIGSASPAEVVNSAHAVVGALSFYQGNDEGPVFASGLVDRTYLEHPHFSMPTISLLRQDISSSKVYGGDEDEIKRLVLLFPFACVSVTDLVMLMNCMEDPRVLVSCWCFKILLARVLLL
ncbi:hypothetical protein, conserved [Eimeria acervulina]|uniref:Uncharacterized protein n=1 Tax=Eimeria acervulina TaxID=5801 RepID=U6GB19_EIMAC|nr:hypothetical protein, conserved [Eimeria acervulina]CDI77335.1 hypothetical protein, conserved [Eimeria acervulina]